MQDILSTNTFFTFGQPSSRAKQWIGMCFYPETNVGSVIARLTSREYAAFVVIGSNEVMMIGGGAAHDVSSSVEVFCFRERLSRPVASLNIARRDHGACIVNKAVVVCGGDQGDMKSLSSCEIYFEGRWSFLPKMMEERYGVVVVAAPDRRIIATGGYQWGYDVLSSVEFYRLQVDFPSSLQFSTELWTSLPPMRKARYGHAGDVYGEYLLVAGGYGNTHTPLSSAEIRTLADAEAPWILLESSLNVTRSWFSLVVSAQGIFAFGSYDPPWNSVELLQMRISQDMDRSSLLKQLTNEISVPRWESLPPITWMERVWGAVQIPKEANAHPLFLSSQ